MKSWILDDVERETLAEIVGYATANIGEDIKDYNEFRKSCTKDELKVLDNIYNVLDNYEIYKKITSRTIQPEELNILIKLMNYVWDKNIGDLSDILDKVN